MNSLKKGTSYLIRHPLYAVATAQFQGSVPSSKQVLLANRFFDICNVQLSRVVSDQSQIDGKTSLPEVAFMGKSNVGKSSLLNAVLYSKGKDNSNKEFARVADHPGYTKFLNFYTLATQLRIIDMPGYGYGSKNYQGELITHYLQYQPTLKRVYLLIPGNIAQFDDLDRQVIDLLNRYGISWQLVFTKMDKLIQNPIKLQKTQKEPESSQVTLLLNKLANSRKRKNINFKHELCESDCQTINNTISQGLELVNDLETAYPQVIGTCSVNSLNFLGISDLRASILQACGLLRQN